MAASRPRIVKRGDSITRSVSAPIGGWNARDSLAAMDKADAVSIENWWVTPTDLMLRKGFSQSSTGFTGQCETLLVYSAGTTEKMFAVVGTPSLAIYEVTAGGAVGAAVVSGLTNARWEYVNVTTAGGSYLYAVNGVDKPLIYDGAAWVSVDAVSTPAITGVTTTTLAHVNLFKTRLWFTQANSLKVWYLPVNAVGGAAAALDFSSIAMKGGYLMAMGTWTLDSGQGADDLAAFITSNGEVIVYKGTDPTDATKWALVGVWQIGAPFQRRCFMKYSGDLLLLTYDGLFPMSAALQSSRLDPRVALTDKIYSAISAATGTYGATFGWDIEYYAKANMLIINIPVAVGSQQQFCMNQITKQWTNFTGWNANCWGIFGDEPYFGGNGFVGKAWDTFADNATNINGNCLQAFNYFGSDRNKRYTMARPTLLSDGTPAISIGLNVDFSQGDVTGSLSYSPSAVGLWDTAVWDTSIWGSGLAVSKQWQGVNGIGYCAGVRLKIATQGIETHWAATDIVMEPVQNTNAI